MLFIKFVAKKGFVFGLDDEESFEDIVFRFHRLSVI